jgi:amino acid permease
MKPMNNKEILEEKVILKENSIGHKISKRKKKINFNALFILIDIISLILTIIFGIFRSMIAFIILLVITIIISLCLLVYFIIEKKRYNKEREIWLKIKQEEERKKKKKEIIDRQFL